MSEEELSHEHEAAGFPLPASHCRFPLPADMHAYRPEQSSCPSAAI